jgi:hypothetical protein
LICAHPPYANIINYTDSKKGDLSFFDIEEFLNEMSKVARESFRVLKPGRQCAILIGDTRRGKHVIPLGFKLINVYLDAGFKLRELVIKRQHNCKTTGFWYANSVKYNFLLLAHEYLPIFEKPVESIILNVKEKGLDYGIITPVLVKLSPKKRLDQLESTTVWIFPEKDFEELLNKNVIDRYSNGKEFSIISFGSHSHVNANMVLRKGQEGKELIFIKSEFLNKYPSRSNIDYYLREVKEMVSRYIFSIKKGRFLVIQTQDIRIDGYVEPLAKKLVDILGLDNLWLKEIVVVTQDGQNFRATNDNGHLVISHQYLIIYEVLG